MKYNFIILETITIFVLNVFLCQNLVLAEFLNSTNYQLENSVIGSGDGGASSSTNYSASGSFGNEEDSYSSSTNFKIFPGFVQHAYPGVPAAPTFTNTGGNLYSALDFVVNKGNGQQDDTQYAIAISSDNFTTTFFIQTDDTLGGSEAWQTYSGWGGASGERVVGLASSTVYKIKVKARFAADTETVYSTIATASTVGSSLTINFSGVSSGVSLDGETTTVTSTSNDITFGALVLDTSVVAAHTTTISTNATGGYTTTIQQDHDLQRSGGSETIAGVSGSNSSPAGWPSVINDGEFGYHSSDESLCSGSITRFSTNDTWAALETTPREVACSTGPVTSESSTISYKLQVGIGQAAGVYSNRVTYITTALY